MTAAPEAISAESLRASGWTSFQPSGFSGVIGPLWSHRAGEQSTYGFIAEPRHGNEHIGTVHGGVLMTFADVAFGSAVVGALGAPNCATAQLQTHFVAAAKIGDFVTCRPEIVRRTSQLIFLRGLIESGGRTVASVDGIWKVFEPRVR